MKLFVYGTLKKGFGNHGHLRNATYIEDATIKGKMYSQGSFPSVDLTGEGIIHGEIYEIDETILRNLDKLEGYPHHYDRSELENKVIVYHIDKPNSLEVKSGRW